MAPLPISSIRVGKIEDVQELIKSKPNKVPERFIRDANERGGLVSLKTHLHQPIPVIDLSKLSKPHTNDDFVFEILKLSQACEDWGFFQVIYDILFRFFQISKYLISQFLFYLDISVS